MKRTKKKTRKEIAKEQTAEVMAKLHKAWKPHQVHHIFGRVGRLAACRALCVPMKKKPGAASHHDGQAELIADFKKLYRFDRDAMRVANRFNRDKTTCWWESCRHWRTCLLAKKAREEDGK